MSELVKKFELKVNAELEAIVPKMTEAEFESLKNSIMEEGLKIPIEVMVDLTIIDGHNRYKACCIVGVEIKEEDEGKTWRKIKDVKTLEEAKAYAFITNAIRRHFNTYVIAEYRLTEKAPQGASLEAIAVKAHLSPRTMDRVRRIMKFASEETKEKLRIAGKDENGNKVTINGVDTSLGLAEKVKEALEYKKAETKEYIDKKYGEELSKPDTLSRGTVDKIVHDIEEQENHGSVNSSYLRTKFYPENTFATKEEAENFAKLCGGHLIGLVTVQNWELRVDYIKEKEMIKKLKENA